MKTYLFIFIISVVFSPYLVFGKPASPSKPTEPVDLSTYLGKIRSSSTPIGNLPTPSGGKKVIIHLFWATWCEYCEQVIASILGMSSEKGFSQVQVNSYSFDEKALTPENPKVKKMQSFNNYQTVFKPKDLPDSLSRLPVTIVEDIEKKTLRVYTGFSNERFKILKKYIHRILNISDPEDN